MKKLALLLLLACDGTRALGEGAPLPAGFLLGAATAAHQIEGGLTNDWTVWEEGSFPDGRPHIENEDRSTVASNSWEQWRDDVAALEQIGANAYRMSVEWSRIEPQPGEIDMTAIARYREQLAALREKDIRPLVTLFHFTLPVWLDGGFENAAAVEHFAQFCGTAATAFGDLVDDWITVNEPNVYALQGYNLGLWPPGVKDGARQTRVMRTLLDAHAACSRALKANDAGSKVGLAHHVRIFQPASSALLDQGITALTDDYFNESIPRALRSGRVTMSIPGTIDINEDAPHLRDTTDFLGINYYTRDLVRADLGSPTLSQQYVPEGRPKNDLGWDIYPEGLTDLLVRYSRFGWPLVVTENGIADADDSRRGEFLKAHVNAVQVALKNGADVQGYLYWSLIDNFEWAEGYSGRFGLFAIDFADPARNRVARPSALVFRAISDRF